MKEKLVCSSCGKELTSENSIMCDGQVLCNDCLENKTTICDNCGERIWNDDVQGDSNTALSNNCYEYNYTHCERCGRVIHNDSAYYTDDEDDYDIVLIIITLYHQEFN